MAYSTVSKDDERIAALQTHVLEMCGSGFYVHSTVENEYTKEHHARTAGFVFDVTDYINEAIEYKYNEKAAPKKLHPNDLVSLLNGNCKYGFVNMPFYDCFPRENGNFTRPALSIAQQALNVICGPAMALREKEFMERQEARMAFGLGEGCDQLISGEL